MRVLPVRHRHTRPAPSTTLCVVPLPRKQGRNSAPSLAGLPPSRSATGFTHLDCRNAGRLPSPLWRGVRGEGREERARRLSSGHPRSRGGASGTLTPSPSPQGRGEPLKHTSTMCEYGSAQPGEGDRPEAGGGGRPSAAARKPHQPDRWYRREACPPRCRTRTRRAGRRLRCASGSRLRPRARRSDIR